MKTIDYSIYKAIKAYNYDKTTNNDMGAQRLINWMRLLTIEEQQKLV